MVRRFWVLIAVLAALAGCTAGPTAAPPGATRSLATVAGWHEIPLPAPNARILAIAPAPRGGLVVLGSVPGPFGRAPAAWTTTDARTWQALALDPHTAYAGQAELISVGVGGGRVTALGQAFGGAHSNPRLTIWTGDPNGLVEYEQPFEMFGGPHAIAVNEAAAIPGTALVVGEWDGATGRYGAAVWTSPDGVVWHRITDDPALASAAGEQTSAIGAAAGPAGFLVAGDTLRGALLTPLAWTSADAGRTWRRVAVPTGAAASDAVGGATADRAACDAAGCVLAGVALGQSWRAQCWPVATAQSGVTVGPGTSGPAGATVAVSQALSHGAGALIALRVNTKARLASVGRDCTGWRDVPLPVVSDEVRLGALGGQLLLATTDPANSRLWMRAG